MSLSQKINDSIQKFNNDCGAEVLYRKQDRSRKYSSYERNYSNTGLDQMSPDEYDQQDDGSSYQTACCDKCEQSNQYRTSTPACSSRNSRVSTNTRQPNNSYDRVTKSAQYRTPSPCCQNPYRPQTKIKCGTSSYRPTKYSKNRCIEPCNLNRCKPTSAPKPCTNEEKTKFPKVCDSLIITKRKLSPMRSTRIRNIANPCPLDDPSTCMPRTVIGKTKYTPPSVKKKKSCTCCPCESPNCRCAKTIPRCASARRDQSISSMCADSSNARLKSPSRRNCKSTCDDTFLSTYKRSTTPDYRSVTCPIQPKTCPPKPCSNSRRKTSPPRCSPPPKTTPAKPLVSLPNPCNVNRLRCDPCIPTPEPSNVTTKRCDTSRQPSPVPCKVTPKRCETPTPNPCTCNNRCTKPLPMNPCNVTRKSSDTCSKQPDSSERKSIRCCNSPSRQTIDMQSYLPNRMVQNKCNKMGSFKYPCFYHDPDCNKVYVQLLTPISSTEPPSEPTGLCCKRQPLASLLCSESGTFFCILPCQKAVPKCNRIKINNENCPIKRQIGRNAENCGDYDNQINNLKSMSNLRSVIFNDEANKSFPCNKCNQIPPMICCPPKKTRTKTRKLSVKRKCKTIPVSEEKPNWKNNCNGNINNCSNQCSKKSNNSCFQCKCSGCRIFGPTYCVQRANCRIPCLCAKYPCLPKF